jgi:hypothetical protein
VQRAKGCMQLKAGTGKQGRRIKIMGIKFRCNVRCLTEPMAREFRCWGHTQEIQRKYARLIRQAKAAKHIIEGGYYNRFIQHSRLWYYNIAGPYSEWLTPVRHERWLRLEIKPA